MKPCTCCKEVRALDAFSIRPSGRPHSWCKACVAKCSSRWAKRHPEKLRATKSRYRQTEKGKNTTRTYVSRTREQQREYVRQWAARNADYLKERDAEYARQNPDKMSAKKAARRMRQVGAPGNGITADQWKGVLRDSLGLCAYCNARPKRLTIDHIEPLITGGAHDLTNVAAVCGSCNSRKQGMPLLVFLARQARLRHITQRSDDPDA